MIFSDLDDYAQDDEPMSFSDVMRSHIEEFEENNE